MKKFLVVSIAIFSIYCFFVNSDVNKGMRNEFSDLKQEVSEEINKSVNEDPSVGGGDVSTKEFSSEAKEYFNKVAYGSEFGGDNTSLKKWKQDVKIYVIGNKRDYLMSELRDIVSELNGLVSTINITIVSNQSDANLVILFGSAQDYNEFDSKSVGYTDHNQGLFIAYGSEEITYATMYVDVERTSTQNGQKHLLREELTQSLGLCNDSYDYPESIFYQGWTETNEYTEIDKEVIQMMYN
jgi:fructose-specific component phosphotransferase system IIB-like protein